MHVGVPSVIALLWVIVISGCAGNEIAPATSDAPAPGDSDSVTALYAAPTDVAFISVSDIRADIVGPDGVPFAATFYGYAAEGALVPPFETLDLALAESDAVPPPVDIDAFFAEAIAAAAADSPPLVWERGPEMQQPSTGWEAPPLDAK